MRFFPTSAQTLKKKKQRNDSCRCKVQGVSANNDSALADLSYNWATGMAKIVKYEPVRSSVNNLVHLLSCTRAKNHFRIRTGSRVVGQRTKKIARKCRNKPNKRVLCRCGWPRGSSKEGGQLRYPSGVFLRLFGVVWMRFYCLGIGYWIRRRFIWKWYK